MTILPLNKNIMSSILQEKMWEMYFILASDQIHITLNIISKLLLVLILYRPNTEIQFRCSESKPEFNLAEYGSFVVLRLPNIVTVNKKFLIVTLCTAEDKWYVQS